MLGAIAGNSSGYNFTALRDENSEDIGLLVIHSKRCIRTKAADFAAGEGTSTWRSRHGYTPSFSSETGGSAVGVAAGAGSASVSGRGAASSAPTGFAS